MKSDDELLKELAEATKGLLMMSESDYPFETIRWDAKVEVRPEFLRSLSKESEALPVSEQTLDEFFRAAASEPEWKGAAELQTARRYQALVGLLKENLSDVKVYRVGAINIAVYVVGRSASRNWLGISTRIIET